MRQFLLTLAGVFAGLVLFFIILPMLFLTSAAVQAGAERAPSKSVLVLDLRGGVTDQANLSPLAMFSGGSSANVVEIVRKLEAAETDHNVVGLYVRAPETSLAPAHAEEIRLALTQFKASGKFIVTHAQGLEDTSLSNYVAVSPSTDIWMQPSSEFASSAVTSQTMFLGGMFEKFDLIPQFEQFYEYKNAVNGYISSDYTPAHREATSQMLTSVYNAELAAVAFDRGLSVEAAKTLLDRAPLTSAQALSGKLITKIGTPEDAEAFALEQAEVSADHLIDIAAYTPEEGGGTHIALVGGEGAILTGSGGVDPTSGEATISSDELASAIRDATDDHSIEAIVLRVSSPGGSPIASEQIWAAIERAKLAKKPVVVSMGAYAASGGYYISTNADKIFAMPSTLTGSIGVYGGKIVLGPAVSLYSGANIREMSVGSPYGTAMSEATPFTNSQREAYHQSLERIYTDFTQKVANGRHVPLADVQANARGHVWTGRDAKTRKLVDEIGGLRAAIRQAVVLAHGDGEKRARITFYPEQHDLVSELASMLGMNVRAARTMAIMGAVLNQPEARSLIEAASRQRVSRTQMDMREPLPQ